MRTATAIAPPSRRTVNSQPMHLKLVVVSLFLVTINFSPLDRMFSAGHTVCVSTDCVSLILIRCKTLAKVKRQ